MKTIKHIITLFTIIVITSCGSENNLSENETNPEKNQTEQLTTNISGVAQKGQFLRGSSITIYALDKNLSATGLSYPTQTFDDMGSFSVNNITADFVDVKANGYYYNENTGATSNSTINLQAIAARNGIVNVNILTTLAYNRIKYLVKNGLSFTDAQNRAQIEVLTALGLGNSTSTNFTNMNIADSGEANGLLLAASLLIQQNRSVGDASKLISDIAADIEEDGLLSADLNQEIHRNERNIYVGSVIEGLINFYNKNNVTSYSIPAFYKFLDTDGNGIMDGTGDLFKGIDPDETTLNDITNINPGYDAEGFTITKRFLSTIPFNVESDAEWLSVEKKLILENIYAVTMVAQANKGVNRTANVIFTSETGNQLAKYVYKQKMVDELVPQRFVFPYDPTIESLVSSGIGVNGKIYDILRSSTNNIVYYVDIPHVDKKEKYQLYFPTSMVSMPNDYGTFKLTIPSIISSGDMPFISQREGNIEPITNPTSARFVVASSVIYIPNIQNTDHIILSSEHAICGSAIYSISEGRIDKDNPQIIESETKADSNGQYTLYVRVNSRNRANNDLFIPVLKCNIPVNIKLYDSSNSLISEGTYYSTNELTR